METMRKSRVEIKAGDPVRIQDAEGNWHDAVADSGLEGTHHGGGRKVHDFPVIWVIAIGQDGNATRMPWPVDFVEPEQTGTGLKELDMSDIPELMARVIVLENELATEKRHADNWQRLAGRYDEIRYALRNALDTPEGHAEFYSECAELIFGEQP